MNFDWLRRKVRVLSPLEGYERWAKTYRAESNPIKDLSNQLIEKMLVPFEGKVVLDAGCGTGHFCQLAESGGARAILGVDLSPAMIEEAKKTCKSTEFRCGDISKMELTSGSADQIICALVLGHIQDLDATLDNLLPALKEDGVIVITDFHPFLSLHHSKRTFRDTGTDQTFEIRHYLHLFQDYIRVFNKHHVRLEQLEEPFWNQVPVVFGLRGRKSR